MRQRLRVVYWNNIPSPYFVERMSTLADLGTLDVHSVFNVERNPDRSWDVDPEGWSFEGHWAPQGRFGLYDPTALVKALHPDLLVTLYGEPSFALNAPRAARHARRWAMRIVPTFDAWERRTPTKEAAKRALGRLADGAKVPGPDGRCYAERLGLPPDRVFEVQQSVPVPHFAAGRDTRDQTRAELGLSPDEFVFVYLGRLWEGKGLRTLLDACSQVPRSRPWTLLVVGDGPMADEIAARTELPIRSLGFVQRPQLPSVLAAADCLLFPTLGDPFGLVVEEAFAAGLPVITSDQMGDAHRRVHQTRAGLVVTSHDGPSWASAMRAMMVDQTQAFHARNAALRSRHIGHDRYAADFSAFAERLIELPPRHRSLRWQGKGQR